MSTRGSHRLALLAAVAALAACGPNRMSASVVSPTATPSPPTTPPATPSPAAITPLPTTPLFTFSVPPGWTIAEQAPGDVQIIKAGGVMSIRLTIDPAQENIPAGTPTVPIGSESGFLIDDGQVVQAGQPPQYRRIVIVSHGNNQFELACIGYAGYDQPQLLSGCTQFAAAVHFTG